MHRVLQLLSGELKLPASVLCKFVESLDEKSDNQDELIQLRRQHHFLSFFTLLLEQGRQEEQCYDPKKVVMHTIDFLEANYHLQITVQLLADMAQLPRWQYLRVFKQLTGSKPSSYITQLRIEQAKKMLRDSDEQVWKVAHQVGFTDEHYFNRRFKLIIGITPGQYARIYHHKLHVNDWGKSTYRIPAAANRIVYDDAGTLGDLLALGISPVGAKLRFCKNDSFISKVQFTEEIGFPLNPNKVRTLKPDLVLLSRYGTEQHPELSAIAPTVGLNEYASMHRRMQKLGEVLGIREQIQRWLDTYDLRCEQMWRELQPRKTAEETATVLFYHDDGGLYLLHRLRGLAKLLYHPLGFRIDKRVQQMRPARGNYYISIDPHRLEQYAVGDRVFVFTRPDRLASAAVAELTRWPNWDKLFAVQSGKVHYLESFWNLDDALTSQMALDRFADLWS